MGIVNDLLAKVTLLDTRKPKQPDYLKGDFHDGLEIIEIIDGNENTKEAIRLVGSFLPLIPFEHGGSQQLVKEYYAGNPEPTVHVLGPRESDVTVSGSFKLKNLPNDGSFHQAAEEYQNLFDDLRRRGNLLRITLGSWRRYGFLEEGKFKINRLVHIDYELKFFIVGLKPPKNSRINDNNSRDIRQPNLALISLVNDKLKKLKAPASMPRSFSDALDDLVSGVADGVAMVTGFVDGIVSDAQQLAGSANRAVGLIRHVRATVSRTSREIGAIKVRTDDIEGLFKKRPADKQKAVLDSQAHIASVQRQLLSIQSLLAELAKKFAPLVSSVPMMRHLVKENDTLQNLAMKYYKNADQWKVIYDHNKLQSSKLTKGSILEIPKL